MDHSEQRKELARLRAKAIDAMRLVNDSHKAVLESVQVLHRAGDQLQSVNRVPPQPEK